MSHYLQEAILKQVYKNLGQEIVNDMRETCEAFSTPVHFQGSLQLYLLEQNNCDEYYSYLSSYKLFAEEWIQQGISQNYYNSSGDSSLYKLADKLLSDVVKQVESQIRNTNAINDCETLSHFVRLLMNYLQEDLVIPAVDLKTFIS